MSRAGGGRGGRLPLMAGNWKMNLTHLEAIALVQKLAFTLTRQDFDATDGKGQRTERGALHKTTPTNVFHGLLLPELCLYYFCVAIAG